MTVATIEAAPLADRMEYARALAESRIIPKAFQKAPADVLVAVEYGNALGIAPIVALSEINVINGTPALSASLMAALARDAGHKVRVTGDAKSATCTIVRADDPDFEHTATWDEQKARDAGLWGRGHWAKDSGTMLRWRAIAECVRFACSEVLGGLKYSADEVRDLTTPTTTVHQTPTPTPTQPTRTLAEALADDDEPAPAVDWDARITAHLGDVEGLIRLHREATAAGAPADVLEAIVEAGHAARAAAADDALAPIAERVDDATGEVLDAEVIE